MVARRGLRRCGRGRYAVNRSRRRWVGIAWLLPWVAWAGCGLALGQDSPSKARPSADPKPVPTAEQGPHPQSHSPERGPRGERGRFPHGKDSQRTKRSKHQDRWRAMGPREREALRDRYRDFRSLEPETREERLQRAQRLRQLIDEVYGAMEPDLRARVDRMDRKERHRYLARLALEEARKRSREAGLVRDRWSERGERSRPGREPGSRGPRPGEGPPRGDRKRHHDFHKRVVQSLQQHVEAHGLPAGADPKQWQAILAMEGREQGRALWRFVRQHPDLRKAMPKPPWEEKLNPRQRVLHRSLRLRPEAHLQVMQAPREERKKLEWSLRREQLLRGMADHPEVFPSEEIDRVRGMDEAGLRAWIQSTGLHHGTGMRRPPRGGRPDRGPRRKPKPGFGEGPGSKASGDPSSPPRGDRHRGRRGPSRDHPPRAERPPGKAPKGSKPPGARSKDRSGA